MKREYIKPYIENVVVKCNEKLMWGELADASNGFDHGDAKGFIGQDDDEEAPIKGDNLWDGWDD